MNRNGDGRKRPLVAPARQGVVDDRIGVLKRYCSQDGPSTRDADAAAAELGMTRTSFYRLVRAWRGANDPADVVAIGGPRTSSGHRPHPGDAFAIDVLRRRPVGASVNRDVVAIEEAARQANVAVRSRTSLAQMVREFRGRGHTTLAFIDHVALVLPIETLSGPTMPIASILGDGGTNRILAILLRLETVGPASVARLLRHAHRTGVLIPRRGTTNTCVAIDADFSNEWQTLFGILGRHGLDRTGDERRIQHGGLVGGDLVSPKLLGIAARPKLIVRPPEWRVPRIHEVHDEVLTLDRAQSLIDDRVAASWAGERPTPLTADVDALLSALDGSGML